MKHFTKLLQNLFSDFALACDMQKYLQAKYSSKQHPLIFREFFLASEKSLWKQRNSFAINLKKIYLPFERIKHCAQIMVR